MANYKRAYEILEEYFDYIPEEDRLDVHTRIESVLNNKVIVHEPPPNTIQRVLKRLKRKYGFGVK
jgi:hypothetical protein